MASVNHWCFWENCQAAHIFVGWSFEVWYDTAVRCVPLSKGNCQIRLLAFFIKGHKKVIILFIRNLSITSLSCISKSSAVGLDNFLMEINSDLTFLSFVMQKRIVKQFTKCLWFTLLSLSWIQSPDLEKLRSSEVGCSVQWMISHYCLFLDHRALCACRY